MIKPILEVFKIKKRPSILGFLEIFICVLIGNSFAVFVSSNHLINNQLVWIARIASTIVFIAAIGKIYLLNEGQEKVEKKYQIIFGFLFSFWIFCIKLNF